MLKNHFTSFKSAIITVIMPALIIGCSATKSTEMPQKNISQYKLVQSKNGLSIAIDPFVESERLKEYFGKDLLRDFNILPILVIVSNENENSVHLRNGKYVLIASEDSKIEQVTPNSASNIVLSELDAAHSPRPLALVPFVLTYRLLAHAPEDYGITVGNIRNRALSERILYRNQTHQGFIYFVLQGKDKLREIKYIKIITKNPLTEEESDFIFNLSL